jgi:hypothetical protein
LAGVQAGTGKSAHARHCFLAVYNILTDSLSAESKKTFKSFVTFYSNHPKTIVMQKFILSTVCMLLMVVVSHAANGNGSETGSVQGTIIDAETKKPVANVTFTAAIHKSSYQKEFVTDEKGNFKISNMPVGEHTIVIDNKIYKSAKKEGVLIRDGLVIKLNFEVKEEEPEDYHPFMTPITIHSF